MSLQVSRFVLLAPHQASFPGTERYHWHLRRTPRQRILYVSIVRLELLQVLRESVSLYITYIHVPFRLHLQNECSNNTIEKFNDRPHRETCDGNCRKHFASQEICSKQWYEKVVMGNRMTLLLGDNFFEKEVDVNIRSVAMLIAVKKINRFPTSTFHLPYRRVTLRTCEERKMYAYCTYIYVKQKYIYIYTPVRGVNESQHASFLSSPQEK